jgi:hypothetical protein
MKKHFNKIKNYVMKKISLFFVALVVLLGLAVSGCYYERGYERPYHGRDHHERDHHHGHDRDDYHHR